MWPELSPTGVLGVEYYRVMTYQRALAGLWVIAGLNALLGVGIWVVGQDLAEFSVGTNFLGFGILVAVIALAAEAVVGAIEGNTKER